MRLIMEIFGYPLGYIMWAMYQLVHNYAVALVLFTVATKLLLLPLSIKQQKGTIKLQIIQPQIQELQNKYKNNPQKLNEEIQALYQRENYSMMSGCLPMLIQFPILFGLIDVIYRPLTHITHLSAEVLTQIQNICTANAISLGSYAPQIDMLKAIQSSPELFAEVGADVIEKVNSLNMVCFGLDMTVTPGFGLNLLVLVPLLSGATAFLMSWITMRNSPASQSAGGSTKMMMYMMPLMSVWFTTLVPVGVGLYWIISNLVASVQAVVLNKFWNPREIAEKMKAEREAREEQERKERIEAKKLAKERGEEKSEKALTQKEINRQKLAAARKRNAEKYGDYEDIEVSDEDLKG
ncbi:YidC/Oxa1 family membrane protein insertase [Angelakisella massiliensis]|uniref:YidC/Oxa1 family membrane protein insertase n=1 Tax=Angelakisella massiliensis TaxID=1871018 RepID=UPI0024B18234|nr:YidC/Oxa1 family membrane protein insertase [Angelakisella massiliensis]